ncbi:MAG: dihydrofolate reductase family protein [Chloroflexi bacterium]|nr:dihydrofolate reductase family protein [Chloroflexota bacterium]
MKELAPLESLWEAANGQGVDLPLPVELLKLYGPLRFPPHPDRPYVIGNFVSTLDGVVSLSLPGQSGGGPISGELRQDRMVMGLLRAAADAVVVGAGTFRDVRNHVWTPDYVFPELAEEYAALRREMGKEGPPLNVIVTAGGKLNFDRRVFQSGEVHVLIVTTTGGRDEIIRRRPPQSVQVAAIESDPSLTAQAILDAVGEAGGKDVVLVEGGPRLIGNFFDEKRLDELFLTLAPQIAGRDDSAERPGLVAGKIFAPDGPLWSRLAGIKRSGSHLFLRYDFGTDST